MKSVMILFSFILMSCFSHANAVTANDVSLIKWNNDATKLALGYFDGSFKIVRSNDMIILFQQPSSDTYISAFAWNNDGTKLAVGYYKKRVDIWDAISFQKLITLQTGDNEIAYLNWELDDALFVGDGGELPTIKFDTNTGNILERYPINYNRIQILSNSMAMTNNIRQVIFINLTDMSVINELSFVDINHIRMIKASPSRDILVVGFIDNNLHIVDMQSLETLAVLDGGEVKFGYNGIVDITFNETGSRLFTITQTGTIRSWDTSTWQLIESTELDTLTFIADFSPDTTQVTYAEWEQGSQIFIRDLCDFVAPDVTTLLNIMPQANTFGEEAQICLTENATYTLTTLLPDITGEITLIGNGAQIVMTGGNRIFNVTAMGSLHLKNVALSGGVANEGGAIYNAGDLTLENVILQNHSAVRGGAIYNAGNLVMNGGAIQNNSASEFGGGIYNLGDMQLDGVNIRNNDASEGGGVYQGE